MPQTYLSELHQAAVEYARSGFPVFPCVPGDKQPAIEKGFYSATTDIEVINAWYAENPEYNIATEPEKSGYCVLDVEAEALGDWEQLQSTHGCIETFTNSTPRGGLHLWFEGSLPPRVRLWKDEGYAIDTRGRGSYVLLPPSRVGAGSYETINDCEVAKLPRWISDRAVAHTTPAQPAPDGFTYDLPENIQRASSWLKAQKPPASGERNHAVFRTACKLKDLGVSALLNLEMIEEWAPLADDFTADEVARIVQSAYENGQNAPGNDAVTPSSEAFASIVANAPKVEQKLSRFHMADEDEQDAEPPAEWQIEGVLPRRGTMCVYGQSGAYKSFLLMDLALGIAAGTEAWGAKVLAPGTVIYGALEGRTALCRERRPAWRQAKGITGKLPFYVSRAPMLGVPGELDAFIAEADKKHAIKPIRAIFFETAAKMLVGCDATRDVPQLVAYCELLAERYDCMVIVSHHAGHDTEKGPKDSSTYRQGFDNVIAVETPKRGSRVAVATVTKFKDFPEPDTPLTFEGKPVAKSLVFQRTTAQQHQSLTRKEDVFAPGKVGGALRRLKAEGVDNAVATGVLASELIPPNELETIEDREATLNAAVRRLNKLAKTLLEAYCTHQPSSKGGVKWHLPDL